MAFEIPESTAVRCTNANPRTELHGDERVRAIDLSFTMRTNNEVLDTLAAGLREHFFCNRAAEAARKDGQARIDDLGPIPLHDIRFPQLKTDDIKWDIVKSRGYRWTWDWGREDQHVDFTDASMGGLYVTLIPGEGNVDISFTVSYNGAELEDNTVYGELCGMGTMGDVHIQLLAPPELVPVKKGWRSGKPDTPAPKDGGGKLFDQAGPGDDDHDDDDTGNEHPAGSPEAALAASVNADLDKREEKPAAGEAAWPFPNTGEKAKRRKAAAAA